MQSVAVDPSPLLSESFKDYCESRTRKLIEAIQPEVLVLVGSEAQTLHRNMPHPDNVNVVNARHPARGGEQQMAYRFALLIDPAALSVLTNHVVLYQTLQKPFALVQTHCSSS